MSKMLLVCAKCGISKPAVDFYIRRETGRPKHTCKQCISRKGIAYRNENKEAIDQRNKVWVGKNAAKIREQHRIYRSTAAGAWTTFVSRKRKGKHSFTISKAEFIAWWTETEKVCAYCGINKQQQRLAFERMGRPMRDAELQIDRKDSSRGYSVENICFACRVCNEHKRDFFSYEQFRRIAQIYVRPRMNVLLKAARANAAFMSVR